MQQTRVKTCDYFPTLSWFQDYYHAEEVLLVNDWTYRRKGFENRCRIGSANGPLVLSVPLAGGRNQQQAIGQIQLAYSGNWQHQQAQAIRSAYGRAPFFEHYYSVFEPVFTQTFNGLMPMNLWIIERILKSLRLKPKHRIVSQVEIITFDKQETLSFPIIPYIQPFSERHGFMADLSILDTLMCCGPQTLDLLRVSPEK